MKRMSKRESALYWLRRCAEKIKNGEDVSLAEMNARAYIRMYREEANRSA